MNTYCVYILASKAGVLYTGVTNNLGRRVLEHKRKWNKGFTRKYQVGCLVYFETFSTSSAAIKREKQIKSYRREKKVALINSVNPKWSDLSDGWYGNSQAETT